MCVSEHESIVIIDTDGTHVGQLKLDYYLNTAFLHDAVIFEKHRRLGIMKNTLNSFIIPKLRDNNISRITLIARTEETREVWTRMGFTHTYPPLMELKL
jgi:hypothetical protein